MKTEALNLALANIIHIFQPGHLPFKSFHLKTNYLLHPKEGIAISQ